MVKIHESGEYLQMLMDLLADNPSFEPTVKKKIQWFRNNPKDTRLVNHLLKGRMTGQYAFSVTDDIRIVYKWLGETTVRFLGIGGHKRVYKKKAS